MDVVVRGFVDSLVLGEAMRLDGFTVLPLYSGMEGTLNYIALQTAIEARAVKVEEIGASGSVGDLLVTNSGECLVLAVDGEELAGAKQNRILNTSVLLERNTKTVIPVSCTEQGRWSYTSVEFRSSNSFAPPRIRENAKRAVNQALENNRGFRTNQGEVWDHVSRLAANAGVHSPTGALDDVVKSRLPELDRMLAALPARPGQCGLIAIANGHVLGFDVVSRPAVYIHLHDRLLRSYLLETSTESTSSPFLEPTTAAAEFLQNAASAEEHTFKSVGLGVDHRYSRRGIVGSALSYEGQLVHAAFFHVPPEEATNWTPGLRDYRYRRDFRTGETHPGGPDAIID